MSLIQFILLVVLYHQFTCSVFGSSVERGSLESSWSDVGDVAGDKGNFSQNATAEQSYTNANYSQNATEESTNATFSQNSAPLTNGNFSQNLSAMYQNKTI
ncbi:hypothetical protein IRJ41_020537 [Triplophysa rosa]|uniref:Uncharacterized protein n=1 Tax=Triplophysa rosa TaxID=992332 RepID=A0A9W7TCA7_TRIRA|nr:hypothetical protein IRJ41_020537 [Triplophysa rosa]